MSKRRRGVSAMGAALLLLGACLIASGCLALRQTPDGYQYVLPAGKLVDTLQSAAAAADGLRGEGHGVTISARRQNAQIEGAPGLGLTLYAVDEAYADACHETLLDGRFISGGDAQGARAVAVIDQDTAFALYAGGDAIGRVVTIEQTEWTVVGVIKSRARLGETMPGVAFVPLSAAALQQLAMDTMELRLHGATGGGRDATARAALRQWRTDGSFYPLGREKFAALMPLRWMGVVVCLRVVLWMFRRWLYSVREQYALYRKMLERHYAGELAPQTAARAGLLLLWGGAAAALAVLTITFAASPALVFPDWIADSPLSLSANIDLFWVLHRQGASAVRYISREMSAVTLAAWLIRWGCLAALGGCLIIQTKRRKTP